MAGPDPAVMPRQEGASARLSHILAAPWAKFHDGAPNAARGRPVRLTDAREHWQAGQRVTPASALVVHRAAPGGRALARRPRRPPVDGGAAELGRPRGAPPAPRAAAARARALLGTHLDPRRAGNPWPRRRVPHAVLAEGLPAAIARRGWPRARCWPCSTWSRKASAHSRASTRWSARPARRRRRRCWARACCGASWCDRGAGRARGHA